MLLKNQSKQLSVLFRIVTYLMDLPVYKCKTSNDYICNLSIPLMNLEAINKIYKSVKNTHIFGRYVTNEHLEKCLQKLKKPNVSILGYSVENRPIYKIKYGEGKLKILLWSQMHGNESTTTKALLDCFNLFENNYDIGNFILSHCTLFVIPILNPDGAKRYTRLNANEIDLNRDAQSLSQPESKVLRSIYNDVKPDFCFNLHGQRTIYNVANTKIPATLAFLSPSQDKECALTPNRKVAMSIISKINSALQVEIPNAIARYDDAFNLNCVGDTFQSFNTPTLLYEAGHHPEDYNREVVRRLVFISILKGLEVISKGVDATNYDSYFDIPENKTQFYDIIIRNAKITDAQDGTTDVAILYKEVLKDERIEFVPVVESISKLDDFFGHKEIDAKQKVVLNSENSMLNLGNEIDFVLINNEKILLKP